jgi:LPXTG-site transpeptidase (sortase) family protein
MRSGRRYWYAICAFVGLIVLAGLAAGSWVWFGSNAGGKTTPVRGDVAHAQGSDLTTATVEGSASWLEGARLIVPSLHIEAPIEAVGVLPDGSMAVPTHNQWDGVGWYAYGPVPGEKGSAVIDGHLDRPGGAPAVFWRLHELHTGDSVMVKMQGEKTLHFRVTMLQTYEPQQAPLATIFGKDSGSYLNLITCAGQWVPAQHQTTHRLVVYTTLVA